LNRKEDRVHKNCLFGGVIFTNKLPNKSASRYLLKKSIKMNGTEENVSIIRRNDLPLIPEEAFLYFPSGKWL